MLNEEVRCEKVILKTIPMQIIDGRNFSVIDKSISPENGNDTGNS